jgi:histidinol dehydrogenase
VSSHLDGLAVSPTAAVTRRRSVSHGESGQNTCTGESEKERLTNYGSLFLGEHSTVAYSDKAIGTNHVLPTNRAARYTGGLWVGKFTKTVTYQKVTAEGTEQVAPAAAAIADAEFMFGHALTCRIRQERTRQRSGAK